LHEVEFKIWLLFDLFSQYSSFDIAAI
jgi:hypothetical protein